MGVRVKPGHLAELGRQGVESHAQKDGEQHHLEGGPNDTCKVVPQIVGKPKETIGTCGLNRVIYLIYVG